MSGSKTRSERSRPALAVIEGSGERDSRPPILEANDERNAQCDTLAWTADQLEEGAVRLPGGSPWRERLVREARVLRAVAGLRPLAVETEERR